MPCHNGRKIVSLDLLKAIHAGYIRATRFQAAVELALSISGLQILERNNLVLVRLVLYFLP